MLGAIDHRDGVAPHMVAACPRAIGGSVESDRSHRSHRPARRRFWEEGPPRARFASCIVDPRMLRQASVLSRPFDPRSSASHVLHRCSIACADALRSGAFAIAIAAVLGLSVASARAEQPVSYLIQQLKTSDD